MRRRFNKNINFLFFLLTLLVFGIGNSSWISNSINSSFGFNFIEAVDFVSNIVVAFDSNSNTYKTIDEAIESVSSGKITVIPNDSLSSYNNGSSYDIDDADLIRARTITKNNLTLASGVTLSIPYALNAKIYDVSSTKNNDGGFADQTDGRVNVSNEIYIADSITFTTSYGSTIEIGGKHSTATQGTSFGLHNATTSDSKYGQLVLGNGSILNNKGKIDCGGYIKEKVDGSSRINLVSTSTQSATLYEPIVIYDWPNGSASTGCVNAKTFPFNFYDLPFVQTTINVDYHSIFYTYLYIRIANKYSTVVNDTFELVSKNTGAFLQLKDEINGHIFWRFCSNKRDNNGHPLTSRINEDKKTYIEIYGNAEIREISFSVSGTKINSSEYAMPFNGTYNFIVRDGGTLNVPFDFSFLPGSSLTIDKGGNVVVDGKVSFYYDVKNSSGNSLYQYSTFLPTIYKSIANNTANKENSYAYLRLGGNLQLNNSFGGYIVANFDANQNTSLSTSSSFLSTNVDKHIYSTGSPYGAEFSFDSYIKQQNITGGVISTYYSNLSSNAVYSHISEGIFAINGAKYTIDFSYTSDCVTNNLEKITDLYYASTFILPGEEKISRIGYEFLYWQYNDLIFYPNTYYQMTDFINLPSMPFTISLTPVWKQKENITFRNVIYRKYDSSGSLIESSRNSYVVGIDIVIGESKSEERESVVDTAKKSLVNYKFKNYTIDGVSYNKNDSFTITDGNDDIYIDPVFESTSTAFSLSLDLANGIEITDNLVEVTATLNPSYTNSNISYEWSCGSNITISERNGNKCKIKKAADNANDTLTCVVKYSSSEIARASVNVTTSCIFGDAQVLMYDGSIKSVKDLKLGDMIKAWNFESGSFEIRPIIYLEKIENSLIDEITLYFDDSSTIRFAGEQTYFDTDELKYIILNSSNIQSYINHRLLSIDNNGKLSKKVLKAYKVNKVISDVYEILSAYDLNFFYDGVLSCTPIVDLNLFEIDSNYCYNKEKMERDIALYGLFTYSDFEKYMTQEAFEVMNIKYFKVGVGKGFYTYDDLLKLAEKYCSNDDFEHL